MTPFHALIHQFLQAFDPSLALVLADACDEHELAGMAKQLREWAGHRIPLDRVYQTGFPSFYNDVHRLAGLAGLETPDLDTYEWLARGSTAPVAPSGTCGLRWRGGSRLRAYEHPDFHARKDNPNAHRRDSRMGFYRICTQLRGHRGDHVDGRDLLAMVPAPLPPREAGK